MLQIRIADPQPAAQRGGILVHRVAAQQPPQTWSGPLAPVSVRPNSEAVKVVTQQPSPGTHFGCRADHAGHQLELARQAVAIGEPACRQGAGGPRDVEVVARGQRPRHDARGFTFEQVRAGCCDECMKASEQAADPNSGLLTPMPTVGAAAYEIRIKMHGASSTLRSKQMRFTCCTVSTRQHRKRPRPTLTWLPNVTN